MESAPQISLIASARRTQNWMNLYRSIGDNNVSFEIVFVGPNKPEFELPSNFRHIQSYTKPTQCVEIASRHATGQLLMIIADDCEFRTEHPLDQLYETYTAYGHDNLIVGCKFMMNGEDRTHELRVIAGARNSPIWPMGGLMSRKLYRDIGGIDRNFIVCGELDIYMRVLAMGGEFSFSDVYIDEFKADEYKGRDFGTTLNFQFGRHDRKLLESLWTLDGQVHFNRAKPVEAFSDVRILEASQGPRGRWRGTSPIMLERLADFRWRLVQRCLVKMYPAVIFLVKHRKKVQQISRLLLRKQ